MQTFKINCKKESLILLVIIHINISKKVNKEAFIKSKWDEMSLRAHL